MEKNLAKVKDSATKTRGMSSQTDTYFLWLRFIGPQDQHLRV